MTNKGHKNPNIRNIMADGSVVEDLNGYELPYKSSTEDFYKIIYSFITGTDYSQITASPKD